MLANSNDADSPEDGAASVPPGWSTNPSARRRRFVLAAFALVGFVVAGYLALYQFGVISTVWEPFFGQGSHKVLDSGLSRSLPVPDAALGAAVYLTDALLTLIGGENRWRTHPWIVLGNGAVALGLGVTGVILLIVQPIAYESYCTLCMLSAFISINLVGPTMEEALASLQYLSRQYTYDLGSPETHARQSPSVNQGQTPDNQRPKDGVSLRFVIGAAIGLWLMASPGVLNYAGSPGAADRVVGPAIFALCIVAMWPATRWLGGLNLIAGAWLLVSPIVLLAPDRALLTNITCGAMLLALGTFIRPTTVETGGGWTALMGSESS
ncbi:MAG TPA: vitamin K epoxide reductase family protein [Nitrolancea sp.]|jgi:uncharacterized membrane protein|nr:vitamin K epoxide reductase family protein [Nitrolancea sp.]